MREALDELCAALTEDEFRGKIMVVLAGYVMPLYRCAHVSPILHCSSQYKLQQ